MELETIDFDKLDIELDPENDTAWLTENQIAEFYDVTQQNVNKHIKRIFEDGELASDNCYKEQLYQFPNGQKRKIGKYNLEMLLHIGYGVKSYRGVLLRQEVTRRLKGEYHSNQTKSLKTIADLDNLELQAYQEVFGVLYQWWKSSLKHARQLRVAPENVVQFAINYMESATGMDLDIGQFLVTKNCPLLIDPDGKPQLQPIRGERSTLVWAETPYGWVRSLILDSPKSHCSIYWVAEDVCQLLGGTLAENWGLAKKKIKRFEDAPTVNRIAGFVDRYKFELKDSLRVINERGLKTLAEKAEYERSNQIPTLLLEATKAAHQKYLEFKDSAKSLTNPQSIIEKAA